ncbi:unnamed protein product [Citrullus colocynthis]|uniref:Uncharacterized protein n=1 Tax=Citrullus colocynthis TaxID=252529 RepID=A0ABP0YMB0_9ROSI
MLCCEGDVKKVFTLQRSSRGWAGPIPISNHLTTNSAVGVGTEGPSSVGNALRPFPPSPSKPEYQQTLYGRQAPTKFLSDSISFGQRILIETQSILLLDEHHELGLNQPVLPDNVDGFIGV